MHTPRIDTTSAVWDEFPAFIAMLRRQGELLDLIGESSGRLSALVDADDPDGIMRLLDERQARIDEITRLNEALAPLRHDWTASTAHLTVRQRDDVGTLMDHVSRLASTVAERDLCGLERAGRRRDEIAAELSSLGRARDALAAYGGAAEVPPMYQDQQA